MALICANTCENCAFCLPQWPATSSNLQNPMFVCPPADHLQHERPIASTTCASLHPGHTGLASSLM